MMKDWNKPENIFAFCFFCIAFVVVIFVSVFLANKYRAERFRNIVCETKYDEAYYDKMIEEEETMARAEAFSFPAPVYPEEFQFLGIYVIKAANDLDIMNVRELLDLANKYQEKDESDILAVDVNTVSIDMIDMNDIFDIINK